MLGDQQEGIRIVLLKKLDRMRAELGWNESPKLERILIERVCQTWLYLHWLEMADTQSKNRSVDLAKHESDRIERAERRHLRAVKMLATVRKMALSLRIDLKAELTVAESKSPTLSPHVGLHGSMEQSRGMTQLVLNNSTGKEVRCLRAEH